MFQKRFIAPVIWGLCLALVILVSDGFTADKTWTVARESKIQSDLLDIYFLDHDYGWIVGTKGTILHTSDGGQNWVPQKTSISKDLSNICFIDREQGWIAGGDGLISHSSDGGQTWLRQPSGTEAALQTIFFIDAKIGWAGGDGGLIIHTTDGGINWVKQSSGTNNEIQDIQFVNPSKGCAVGGGTTILSSEDGGETWVERIVELGTTLTGVCLVNNEGWAVGANGALAHTADGITWEVQESRVPNTNGMPEPIWGVHFINNQRGLAVAEFGVILKTEDGGGGAGGGEAEAEDSGGWQPLSPRPTGNRLQDVQFVSETEAWAVGRYGTIIHST
nr:hypothetical protein [bacterium]